MKKILACMSLVFALSAGATALAAELDTSKVYDSRENSLKVGLSGATYKNTILITKDNDTSNDGIVFVDQNDSTFSTVGTFLLKGESLAPGTYTVKMNNAEGNGFETKTFMVAEDAPTDAQELTQSFRYDYGSGENARYHVGFLGEGINLSNYKFIAVTNKTIDDNDYDKTIYYPIGATLNTPANVAVKINNIPNGVTLSVSLVEEQPNSSENQ